MTKRARTIATFFHFHLTGVHPPKGFLQAFSLFVALLILGTLFYTIEEGWSVLDAFYFCVVTITTVGYGDLSPTTPLSKLFTTFLIFSGMGIGIYVITTFSESVLEGRAKRVRKFETLLTRIRNRG